MLHYERPQSLSEFVVHELDAGNDGNPLTDGQLWEALTRTFQSPRYQPPMLPAAAAELLSLSSMAEVDVDAVVDLLESDALLAGRVLKLCSSPLYGAALPVPSLDVAVERMGLCALRDVVMEAALGVLVFKTQGYSEAVDRVRVHSTAVAHLARAITRFTSFEADCAFLCGLLHDVGFSAALVALGDVPRGQKLRPVVDLWPALAALHETVGGSVATLWKLPAEISMVLRLHHTMKVGEVVHPIAAIVVLAESIAADLGFALVPHVRRVAGSEVPPLLFGPHRIDRPSWTQVATAKAALGFDAEVMKRISAAAVQVLQAVQMT